jgi:hypothetical protein
MAVFEGATGRRLWSIPVPRWKRGSFESWFHIDPTGAVVATITEQDTLTMVLRDLPTGRSLGTQVVPCHPSSLGPGGSCWLEFAIAFRDLGREGTVRRLSIPQDIGSELMPFSRDGRRLAYGTYDGSVKILDFEEMRSRLAVVGLGW